MKNKINLLIALLSLISGIMSKSYAQYTGGIGRGDIMGGIFSTPAGGNGISVGTVAGPYCAGASFSISYMSAGSYNANNVYTAQLSDASGSFASPQNIGTFNSSANTGSFSVTLPAGSPSGTAYSIRIISSNPSATGEASAPFTINALVSPTISISASQTTICTGQSVTFNASVSNGGSGPGYQWFLNGFFVGNNSASYTTTALANGDVITCEVTSNATCLANTSATSNAITMSVVAFLTPTVSIAGAQTTVCAGTSITFTATPTNGGSNPVYQWRRNGNNVGSNSPIYTFNGFTMGDVINCTMTSNDPCANPATANSNDITLTVNPVPVLNSNPNPPAICSGQVFNYTPTSATPGANFSWSRAAVPGISNGAASGINNPNEILINTTAGPVLVSYEYIVSIGGCSSTSIVNVVVNPSLTPSVTISPDLTTICGGTSVTFTAQATDAGSAPSYQWFLNGAAVGGNSQQYINNTLSSTDVVNVEITSNATCSSPQTALSTGVSINVIQPSLNPAGISGNSTVCAGGSGTTLTVQGGSLGTGATWNWYSGSCGGIAVGSGNSVTVNPTLSTTYFVRAENTQSPCNANSACAQITVNVLNEQFPAINISTGQTQICTGQSLTFSSTVQAGGSNPQYQWSINGSVVGTNSPNFTFNNFNDGDVVQCQLTSNANCVSNPVVQSNPITINVVSNLLPAISITSTANSVCEGQLVTFSSFIQNGGSNPSYQWKRNGVNIGFNLPDLITNTFQSGDIITCELSSSLSCASPQSVLSNGINMNVTPNQFALAFDANTTTLNQPPFNVSFTNNTTNPAAYNFTWFFGDGTTSNLVSPSHQYVAPGVYSVTLLAQSVLSGCTDTLLKANYITCTNAPQNCNHLVQISPAGPVNACLNGSVTLTATTNAQNPIYQWTVNGVNIGGATQNTFQAIASGSYAVIVYDNGVCPVSSNPTVINFVNPQPVQPVISTNGNLQPCGQGSVNLSTTAPGASLLWSTGATTSGITVTQGGTYSVTATYGPGCQATSQPMELSASFAANPGICLVTVDSVTQSNLIVWEPPLSQEIDSFYIYKEGNQANIYNKIGAVSYTDLSEFNDVNSNPLIQGYRYKIAVLDTCGGLTALSAHHKTIHLQVFPGLNNSRQLSWSHYEGINFSSYQIWRQLPGQNMQLLATLPSNLSTYTDINPPSVDADYRLDIVLPQVCTSIDRASYGKSRSNVSNNQGLMIAGVSENAVKSNYILSPNPGNGKVDLTWFSDHSKPLRVELLDSKGAQLQLNAVQAQKGMNTLHLDYEVAAGLYYLRISDMNGGSQVQLLMVNP